VTHAEKLKAVRQRENQRRLLCELQDKAEKSPKDADNYRLMREWYEERYSCNWIKERKQLGR